MPLADLSFISPSFSHLNLVTLVSKSSARQLKVITSGLVVARRERWSGLKYKHCHGLTNRHTWRCFEEKLLRKWRVGMATETETITWKKRIDKKAAGGGLAGRVLRSDRPWR